MKRSRVQSYTNRYLDAVIGKLHLPSDYALAEVLGVSTQAIYKLRGGGVMGVTTAAKIADLLELDVLKVIAETELERGSDRDFWSRIRDVAAWVAVAIGAACFGLAPSEAYAARFNNNGFAVNLPAAPAGGNRARSSGHEYTLRRIRRRSIGAAIAALIAWLAGLAL